MPRKKLQNRLDSLFEDLKLANQEEESPGDAFKLPEDVRAKADQVTIDAPFLSQISKEPDPQIEEAKPDEIHDQQVDFDRNQVYTHLGELREQDTQPIPKTPMRPLGRRLTEKAIKKENFWANEPKTRLGKESLSSSLAALSKAFKSSLSESQNELDPGVLAVPFLLNQHEKALLEIVSESSRKKWTEDDQILVERVTDQLSLALENAYLIQETQAALAEAEALYAITQASTHSMNLSEILGEMLERLLVAIGLDAGTISVYNHGKNQQEIIANHNFSDSRYDFFQQVGLFDYLSEQIYQSNIGVVIPDLNEQISPDFRIIFREEVVNNLLENGITAFQGVPLRAKGKRLGTLCAFGYSPWLDHNATQSLIQAACHQIGISIENAQLFADEQHRRQIADSLRELASLVGSTLDIIEIADRMLDQLEKLIDYQIASIHLVQNGKRVFTASRNRGETLSDLPGNPDLVFEGLFDQAYQSRQPVLIPDTEKDPRWINIFGYIKTRSWLCAPLVVGQEVLGYLVLDSLQPGAYTDESAQLTVAFASQTALAIRNARLYEQIQAALSETDRLYRATAEINAVQTYAEILEILQKSTLLGNPRIKLLSLFIFEQSGSQDHYSETLVNVARVITESNEPSYNSHSLVAHPNAKQIYRTMIDGDQPVVLRGFNSNSNIPQPAISWYVGTLKAASVVLVPLYVGSQWIGLIEGVSLKELPQFQDGIQILTTLVSQAAVAVQNLRLMAESEKRADQLRTAAEIARDSTSVLLLNDLLSQAVHLIRRRYGFYNAVIYLINETDSEAIIRAASGPAAESMLKGKYHFQVGSDTAVGRVSKTGQLLLISDVNNEPLYQPHWLLPDARAEVLIPLNVGGWSLSTDSINAVSEADMPSSQQQTIGVLSVHAEKSNELTSDSITVLQLLVDQLAVAVDNARLYEDQLETADQLRELDRLKSQFLANMSHELRTPLNSILGFSKVMLREIDGPITENQVQDLNAIHQSGTHLLELINDILDISKIEAGKMDLSFVNNVNIGDLITSAMSTAVGITKDKPIKLEKIVEPNLPSVTADPTRIRQVLINFLSNAAKYSEQGTITVRAYLDDNPEIEGDNQHNEVIISVTDSGPGISVEDQANLFKPFTQVDSSPTRKVGGSGLGLSISRLLVELHKGRIGVESKLGQGATFFFALPVASDLATELDEDEWSTYKADLDFSRVVFIVGDEQTLGNKFERSLLASGYQIVFVSDTTDVVDNALQMVPHAIILDIQLQNTDCWQVLYDLKMNSKTQDIPVILCSILEEKERGINLGIIDLMANSILEDNLTKVLHRVKKKKEEETNLLVIDDNQDRLDLIQNILHDKSGLTIRKANTTDEGIASIQAQPPDLVLLGLAMPDLMNFKVLDFLRGNLKFVDIPVIFLMGAELTPEDRVRLNEKSIDLLYRSVISEKEILNSVARCLLSLTLED